MQERTVSPIEIWKRVGETPLMYAGEKDIKLVNAYLSGYTLAVRMIFEHECDHLRDFSRWLVEIIGRDDLAGSEWSDVLLEISSNDQGLAFNLFNTYFGEFAGLYQAPAPTDPLSE